MSFLHPPPTRIRGFTYLLIFSLILALRCIHLDAAKDPSLLPAGMPSSLKFGFTGPLSTYKVDGTVNVDTRALGQPALVGYLLAIDEANNSTEWLPGTTIEGLFRDTRSDSSDAIFKTFELADAGVISLVGDVSATGFETQNILKKFFIPQIAPNNYAVDYALYHKTLYPYFMRTSLNVPLIMTELSRLIGLLGYTRASLFYATDAYLSGCYAPFAAGAAAYNIELPVVSVYLAGEKDWSPYIDRILAAGVRVIVYMGNPTDLMSFWRFAAAQPGDRNIISENYLWICNHALTAPYMTNDAKGPIADMIQFSAGQLGLMIHSEANSPAKLHFDALYRQMQPHPNASTVDLTKPATSVTQFSYDAAWQAIRGLHRMIYELKIDPRPLENRPQLYETIRNVTWYGATGPVQLDANGDRQQYFDIGNFKRATSTWTPIGYMGASHTIDFFPNASIEWPGGDGTVKPTDRPARQLTVLSESVKHGVLAGCIIILVICALLQGMITIWREDRVMRASSPVFLFIYLIGVQLLCLSSVPRTMESDVDKSPMPCNADLFLANIGYTLLIGSILVKTVRLRHIFKRTKLHSSILLTDAKLLYALSILVVLESALLIGLAVGDPMSIQKKELRTMEDYYSCRTNDSGDDLIQVYLPVIMVTRFLLLVVTAAITYRIRNIPETFNESRQLGIVCYNLLFLSILLPAIDGTLGRGLDASLVTYASCLFLICFSSVCIMLGPKCLLMYQNTQPPSAPTTSEMSSIKPTNPHMKNVAPQSSRTTESDVVSPGNASEARQEHPAAGSNQHSGGSSGPNDSLPLSEYGTGNVSTDDASSFDSGTLDRGAAARTIGHRPSLQPSLQVPPPEARPRGNSNVPIFINPNLHRNSGSAKSGQAHTPLLPPTPAVPPAASPISQVDSELLTLLKEYRENQELFHQFKQERQQLLRGGSSVPASSTMHTRALSRSQLSQQHTQQQQQQQLQSQTESPDSGTIASHEGDVLVTFHDDH